MDHLDLILTADIIHDQVENVTEIHALKMIVDMRANVNVLATPMQKKAATLQEQRARAAETHGQEAIVVQIQDQKANAAVTLAQMVIVDQVQDQRRNAAVIHGQKAIVVQIQEQKANAAVIQGQKAIVALVQEQKANAAVTLAQKVIVDQVQNQIANVVVIQEPAAQNAVGVQRTIQGPLGLQMSEGHQGL